MVLTTLEIIERLEAKGVTNAEIARLLKIAPSRVKGIKDLARGNVQVNHTGKPRGESRNLRHEEAVKLVHHYGIEDVPRLPPSPLTIRAARVFVGWLARQMGAELSDELLATLAGDLAGYVAFAALPEHRDAIRDLENNLQAAELRRLAQEEDPPEDRPSAAQ